MDQLIPIGALILRVIDFRFVAWISSDYDYCCVGAGQDIEDIFEVTQFLWSLESGKVCDDYATAPAFLDFGKRFDQLWPLPRW
jgi:hypothetical protein